MFFKRGIVIGLVLTLVLVGGLTACSTSTAQPSTVTQTATTTATKTAISTTTTTAISTTTSVSTTTTTSTATASALDQVIAGAKKEGTVSIQVASNVEPIIPDLEKAIQDTYGVSLNIQYTPSGSVDTDIAKAVMEYKSGATPSYDLMGAGLNNVLPAVQAGALQSVDWSSLIPPDVASKVLISSQSLNVSGPMYYDSVYGIMYNPTKISASEAPKTFSDLANPAWKGKVGIPSYTPPWNQMAFFAGRAATLSNLQAILKNGAIQGRWANLANDFNLGTTWVDIIASDFWNSEVVKGMTANWVSPGALFGNPMLLFVPKGAAHLDAAELVAVYLTSPAGAALMAKYEGNPAYSGNFVYNIVNQATQQGLPVYNSTDAKYLQYIQTDQSTQDLKQIQTILTNGG